MGDKTKGLYNKFIVRRADGTDAPGEKHHGCAYFVLDLTHDPHVWPALFTWLEQNAEEALVARVRALSRRLRLGVPNLAEPRATVEEGHVALLWGTAANHFDIEFFENGRVEWFGWLQEGRAAASGEGTDTDVLMSSEVLRRLAEAALDQEQTPEAGR